MGRGHGTTHRRPIISVAAAQLGLVSFARSAVRGPTAEGLLYPIHSVEPESPWTGPFYFRAPRLGPRAFSVGVVNSLRGSFVWVAQLKKQTLLSPSTYGCFADKVAVRCGCANGRFGDILVYFQYSHRLLSLSMRSPDVRFFLPAYARTNEVYSARAFVFAFALTARLAGLTCGYTKADNVWDHSVWVCCVY